MSESAETAPTHGDSSRVGSSRVAGRHSDRERRPGRIRGIGLFFKQVVAELRKVIWPTRKELLNYTSVVLVFVTIMVLLVSAFDFTFSQLVLAVFGDPGASD